MLERQIEVAAAGLAQGRAYAGTRRAARILSFVVFTFVGAQLAVRLPFTPVPVTMQTLFVILAGLTLGSRDALFAMTAYLALGASGVPLFAGFTFGPLVLLGPTGGYLLAFPAAAFLSGWLHEAWGESRPALFGAAFAGSAVILCMGTLHLTLLTGASFAGAASLGLLPFLAGELIKDGLAAATARR